MESLQCIFDVFLRFRSSESKNVHKRIELFGIGYILLSSRTHWWSNISVMGWFSRNVSHDLSCQGYSLTLIILMNSILDNIATCNFLFQWLCLHFTVTNNSCQVWLCTKKKCKHFYSCSSPNNIFFLQLPALSCCFNCSIISYHCHLLTTTDT